MKTDGAYDDYVRWFSSRDTHVVVLPCETHRAHIYFDPLPEATTEATVRRLCAELAALPVGVKQQWDDASFKQFYIGYEVGEEPSSFADALSPETLACVIATGAGIGLALYSAKVP